jgi:hypothetical protein
MGTTNTLSLLAVALAAVLVPGLSSNAGESSGTYELVKVENPALRGNHLFGAQEDLRSPRFRQLRDRYELDKVVEGETNEFQRILLLRHWIKKNIRIENDHPTETRGDAFGILDAALQGGGFHCGHFMVVQNAVLNAFGYVTRCLGVGPGGTPDSPGGHHGVNEVWSNDFCKWVLIDAKYDTHFEKDGIPLSALEVRDELLRPRPEGPLRGRAADLACVKGPERARVAGPEEPEGGPVTYRWLTWEIQGDRHSNWPHFHSSALVTWDDEYSRSHTWWRRGRTNKHWAYEAEYFVPTRHRAWIEWTPNVLDVTVSVERDQLRGKITSCTPNLREYQVRVEPGGDWRPIDPDFTLPLSGPRHEWRLRAVNLAGVAGPPYRLVVQQK